MTTREERIQALKSEQAASEGMPDYYDPFPHWRDSDWDFVLGLIDQLEARNATLKTMVEETLTALDPLQCGGEYSHLVGLGRSLIRDGIPALFNRIKELEAQVPRWRPAVEGSLPDHGQHVLVRLDPRTHVVIHQGERILQHTATFVRGKVPKAGDVISFADQHANNLVPYAWRGDGPCQWFGQDVVAWMPLPPATEEGIAPVNPRKDLKPD